MKIPCFTDRELLDEVRREFRKVTRGLGVTLHETEVVDNYGSDSERAKARLKDTDTGWWEVRDEWLDEIQGVGGPCFLDDAGVRYYLPAYMSYWLRTKSDPGSLDFHLDPKYHDFQRLFTAPQFATIARFAASFCLFNYEYHQMRAPRFYEQFWAVHWESPPGTEDLRPGG